MLQNMLTWWPAQAAQYLICVLVLIPSDFPLILLRVSSVFFFELLSDFQRIFVWMLKDFLRIFLGSPLTFPWLSPIFSSNLLRVSFWFSLDFRVCPQCGDAMKGTSKPSTYARVLWFAPSQEFSETVLEMQFCEFFIDEAGSAANPMSAQHCIKRRRGDAQERMAMRWGRQASRQYMQGCFDLLYRKMSGKTYW